MSLAEIVSSNVSIVNALLGRSGFSLLCFLSPHDKFEARSKEYASVKELEADGFTAADPEHAAATVAFSQTYEKPSKMLFGRRLPADAVAQVQTVTVAAVADGAVLSLSLGFDTIEHVIPAGQTIEEARDAIFLKLPSSWPFATAKSSTDAITFTGSWLGVAFAFTAAGTGAASLTTATTTAAVAPTETASEALSAIEAAGASFFGVTTSSTSSADRLAISAWTETRGKLFGYRISDADSLDIAVVNDDPSNLKALSRGLTYGFWHFDPSEFPEVSLSAGRLAVSLELKSPTWEFMVLPGVRTNPTNVLDTTARNALRDKNLVFYEDVGAPVVINTKVASGESIDIIVGIEWFKTRLQERAFNRMQAATLASAKLDYTNAGGRSVLESELRNQHQDAVDTNFLREEIDVVLPDADAQSAATKASRALPLIQYTIYPTDAIHTAGYSGVLTR